MLQEQKFQHKQMFELWIHNKKLHAGTSGTTESPAVQLYRGQWLRPNATVMYRNMAARARNG